ncbi:MAG: hypothetical protein ABIF18_03065 [archaeon]
MVDKYLEKFNELKSLSYQEGPHKQRVKNIKEGRKAYKDGIKAHELGHERHKLYGDNLLEKPASQINYKDKLMLMGWANKELKDCAKKGFLINAVVAAEAYEKLGKGNKPWVKNKVLEALENYIERTDHAIGDERSLMVKEFLERNSTGEKGLENKVTVFITSVGIAGGLLFLSPNLTGNVVGTLSNSSSNLIGGVLFFVGLVGAFFLIKRK